MSAQESHNTSEAHQVEDAQSNEEEFIDVNEVGEEVYDDDGAAQPPPDDDDNDADEMEINDEEDEHEHETLEIDMSNNSWSYFDKHQDSVFTIVAHPRLPMVLTGGGDNVAYLWTTHSQPPKFVGEIQGHTESVISAGFTNDGKYLITADMNGLVQVFKASKGGEKWNKFGELNEVGEVLFVTAHPELNYFAFGANDGSIWVYQIDEESKSLVQIMSGFSHTLECNGAVFIPGKDENDLTLVSISEDGTVVNWNCFTGAVNYKLQPHDDFKGVESPWVTIKHYGHVIAVGGRDGQLSIINNDTGKILTSVKTLDNVEDVAELSIEALCWCNNKNINLLAVGLVSGDVLLFDTQQWRLRKNLKVDDAITKLEFINDTPFLVGSSMNGKIYKWDARTGEELFVGVGHNMGILDFAILENGKKVATAGDEGVSLLFVTE
ncbi:WD domain, G-beta repeat family protein [Candida parapsilosis]|uniref:WD domain, G-beta repeat family protein n=1 Tax=Candida parapsilosis TaxID=5480 RepID=A0A8X7TCE5_CANPA|nr:WD domain, G-beta repeat family protein [Candida parapsilosis]KAF6050073.1 WD domain, G-beta repeat family protein [Candida parapsilosis]KAF6057936.1 WD domain, G-beta repeat family protein [Candida parapsilosis]KAF6065357.1 WD domain, G-beta repeat family protein [Candida parapsilosis]KAI5903748.1 Ribosome assembly protein SQT1 [Candida parapsilosis]